RGRLGQTHGSVPRKEPRRALQPAQLRTGIIGGSADERNDQDGGNGIGLQRTTNGTLGRERQAARSGILHLSRYPKHANNSLAKPRGSCWAATGNSLGPPCTLVRRLTAPFTERGVPAILRAGFRPSV